MNCVEYVALNVSVGVATLSPPEAAFVSRLQRWQSFLESRAIVALCCFGVVGNVLNLLALTRRSLVARMGPLEKSATCGLVALALSDLLFCLLNLPSAAINTSAFQWVHPGFEAYYQAYSQPVINIFVISSTWLTVVMALSRYLAICHPLHARLIVDMKFAKASIALVFLGSLALGLPRFWHLQLTCYELSPLQRDSFSHPRWYALDSGPLGRGTVAWRVYIICYFILAVLLPVLALAFCNVYLMRALHQSNKMRLQFARRDRPSSDTTRIVTLTLSVIVIANIVLVAPCEVFTFVDQIVDREIESVRSHHIYNLLVVIFNVLQVLSFSFNFVLYVLINAHFRRAIREVLSCRRSSSFSTLPYDSVTTNTHLPLTSSNRLSEEDIYDKRKKASANGREESVNLTEPQASV